MSSPDAGSRCSAFTLIEMMFSLVCFVVVAVALLQHLTISYSSSRDYKVRVFAYVKAQAILAEMQAVVAASGNTAAIDLDIYDDGGTKNPVLSIEEENGAPIAPDHAISGNFPLTTDWEWYRQITVRPLATMDNRNMRYVTVTMIHRSVQGVDREIASLSAVINSLSSGYPSAQVFDVYFLAIENIPSWSGYMEGMAQMMEAMVLDLESRNPGLELRTHWITKASYGRNQQYKPYINSAVDSLQAVPYVYYYPGLMPSGSASMYYYPPSLMKARMNQDGTEVHGYDANLNPYPYALADFYNHAMRLPKEREWHDLRIAAVQTRKAAIAAAIAANTTVPPDLDDMSEEPTLRLLMEDMDADPDKYRNALIMNLHGDLLPMPSIRNYSDPAKSQVYPGLRAVTHPEELRTKRGNSIGNSDDVFLRVYSWSADPTLYYTSTEPTSNWIMLDIMDVDLRGTYTAGPSVSYYPFHDDGEVQAMYGGVTYDGSKDYPPVGFTDSGFPDAKAYFEGPYPWPAGKPMRYFMYFGTLTGGRKFTRMYLLYTPIRCDVVTSVVGAQGLFNNTSSRLYGLEYNPAPTRDDDFDRDLAAIDDGPKNTARWRIKIPKEILGEGSRWYKEDGSALGAAPSGDVRLTIRTFIYDGSTPWPQQPGVMYPTPMGPDNLSETYAWWGKKREAVPITERSQFLGDPRFNPYKDLLNGDADFGDGYNWFFDSFNASVAADFPGIVRRFDRFDGAVRQDAPRFYELLRNGLVKSNAVFSSMNGHSNTYIGHGNEIGYDLEHGYKDSIKLNQAPFGGTSSQSDYVDNINGFRRYVRGYSGNGANKPKYWWGMPWLGELYPDGVEATQWRVTGNLVAGKAPNQFYRKKDSLCVGDNDRFAPNGTNLLSATQRTGAKGAVSFFNNGTTSLHFDHKTTSGTGTVVGSGLDLQKNYGIRVPDDVPSNRPFTLTSNSNVPPEFIYTPYSADRQVASLLAKYFEAGSSVTAGAVTLKGATGSAYLSVNGLELPITSFANVAAFSTVAMLQTYFEAGATSLTHRIEQPPQIAIRAPDELTELKNPSAITLTWDTDWLRWDGKKYTEATPTTFTENEAVIDYSIMCSGDRGVTWKQLEYFGSVLTVTTTDAKLGEKPTNTNFLVPDSIFGQESISWNVPSTAFPEGAYLVRIEAYRQGHGLHYSHHTQQFFIER